MSPKKLLWRSALTLSLISLCACESKQASSNSDKQNLVEIKPFNTTFVSLGSGENYREACYRADAIYGLQKSYDESTGDSIICQKITDNTCGEKESIWEFQPGVTIASFTVDDSQNLYAISQEEESYSLKKYAVDGTLIYESALESSPSDLIIYSIEADQAGNSYLLTNLPSILLFDANGNATGQITLSDNDTYATLFNDNASNVYYAQSGSSSDDILSKINFEQKALEEPMKDFQIADSINGICETADTTFLIAGSDSLYQYDPASFETSLVVDWSTNDMNGQDITGIGYSVNNDLYVVTQKSDTDSAELTFMCDASKATGATLVTTINTTDETSSDGTTSSSNTQNDQTPDSEDTPSDSPADPTEKQTIVLGCIFDTGRLTDKINAFNRSNDRYRVEVKYYTTDINEDYFDAITRLNLDLASGNAPDLIDITSIKNIKTYTEKGILEDLTPYLEKSSILSKDDFFETILDSATYNGKLAWLTPDFTLDTCFAKSALVGNKAGWDIDDILTFSEKHPDIQLFESQPIEFLISSMISLSKDSYIDPHTGDCHFDTPEFKKLLQFLVNMNEQTDEMNDSDSFIRDMVDEKVLLYETYIDTFNNIPCTYAIFDNEPVTAIGFPSNGKNNGCEIQLGEQFAISGSSKYKDGAWAFLESILSNDLSEDKLYSGFSSRKSIFAKQKATAIAGDYSPAEKDRMNYAPNLPGENSWSYKYRPITQSEADLVEQLVANGVCSVDTLDYEIENIIYEELEPLFAGAKGIDETAATIQNRVNLYMKEQN